MSDTFKLDVIDVISYMEWLTDKEIAKNSGVTLKETRKVVKQLYDGGYLERKETGKPKRIRYRYPNSDVEDE